MAEPPLDPILAALSYETIEWLRSFRDNRSFKEVAARFGRDERTIAQQLMRLDQASWVSQQAHILEREAGRGNYRLTQVGEALVERLERVSEPTRLTAMESTGFMTDSSARGPYIRDSGHVPIFSFDHISPDQFEVLVSALLSRELNVHRMVRTGNDGGEDCYFADEEGEDIYRVKSFTGRMSGRRRREVEQSLVCTMERRPRTWTLVIPIDPTLADRDWFESLRAGASARLDWKGKTWLEEKLAQYPEITHYFAGDAEETRQLSRNIPRNSNLSSSGSGGHVFVSYVSEDSKTVDRLQRDLESAGVEVWRDRSSLGPGDRWKDSIRHAIETGAYFICCFSDASSKRGRSYMNEELNLAVEELRVRNRTQVWFLPVIFPGGVVPDWPVGAGETLRDFNFTILSPDTWADALTKLIRTIQSPSNRP
jgi:hypothetical protein